MIRVFAADLGVRKQGLDFTQQAVERGLPLVSDAPLPCQRSQDFPIVLGERPHNMSKTLAQGLVLPVLPQTRNPSRSHVTHLPCAPRFANPRLSSFASHGMIPCLMKSKTTSNISRDSHDTSRHVAALQGCLESKSCILSCPAAMSFSCTVMEAIAASGASLWSCSQKK